MTMRSSIVSCACSERNGLPCLDGLAQQGVHGLGERRAGVVSGDIQEADHVLGENIAAGDWRPVVLSADASDAQPGDLIAALAGKQPVRVIARIISKG
jgi:hypothetical protein